jgi:hypothetical protein
MAAPVVKVLGQLKPDARLVARIRKERLELDDFCSTAAVPDKLRTLMKKHGYETDEPSGMLYASDAGVSLHSDEQPAILWILHGTDERTKFGRSHQLIVGTEAVELEDGMVLWFDSSVHHAVVACNHELWGCYSIYCEEIKQ